MPTISFGLADVQYKIRNKTLLKSFIIELFSVEKKQLKGIQYVFCSDDFLLDINQRYLGHDTYTDIITFDLSEGVATIGEIYISTDRVVDNSNKLDVAFENELYRVMFHGALHLCGYKDKKKSEKEVMRYKEDHYLRLYQQQLLQKQH